MAVSAATDMSSRSWGGTASWAERLLAFVERSHLNAAGLLLALSLVCFLPGFSSLQPMDRDEPRFAQATKQMLETGDFVDIRFQDEARYKKPIGIHWLQAASVEAAAALGVPEARTTMGVYRVPSLLGALAAVLLVYWAALAFAGRREAFLCAALVASCVILSVEARLAKTDAVLLACCVAAMGALARAWLARGLGRQSLAICLVFWIAAAAGILIKGPMIVMFTGLTAVTLSAKERSVRWLGELRPGPGLLILALAVLPWFAAIAWKSGGEFFRLAIGDDMLGKVTSGQQKHGAPPGFYLVAFFGTFWPGAALATLAVPFGWRHRGDDAIAFLIAWIAPAWLIFEAVPTKLPHYVMPLYPAIAILTVLAMSRRAIAPERAGAKAIYGLVPLVPIGLAVALGIGGWWLDGTVPLASLPLLAASAVLACLAWRAFGRGEVTRSALAGIAASALLSIGAFGLAQPVLQSLKLSPRLVAALNASGCQPPVVETLGYREPSLVFLAGTDLTMASSAEDAASFMAGPGCRVALVDSRFEPSFRAALDLRRLDPALVARVAGFNINGGRRTEIAAYAKGP